MAQFNAQSVFGSFVMENGSFDLNGCDKLIAELRTLAKDKRAEMKDVLAEQKKATKDALSVDGKAFYEKLAIGDEFGILIGGKEVAVKKIATKSKTVGSAACAIINWVDDGSMGKSANRYLGFDKVVIDDRFEEVAEDEIEEPNLD